MIAACRICLSLLVLLLMACFVQAEIHTWTDSTGKYKTDAEFVSLDDGVVTLRKKNGKEVELALERLSEEDQLLAQELARLPKSAPRPAPSTQAPNNVLNSVRGAGYRLEAGGG